MAATLNLIGPSGVSGTYKLDFDSAKLRVWNAATRQEIAAGQSYAGTYGVPVDLLLEGIATSASVRHETITASFTPSPGSGPVAATDTLKATVFKLDLKVESSPGSNAYLAEENAEGDDPAGELSRGGILPVNDDDDNADGVRDYQQKGTDADLLRVQPVLTPGDLDLGSLGLTADPAASVVLWKDAARATAVSGPWNAGTQPPTVWVEGLDPSDAARDVGLTLAYTANGSSYNDDGQLTVVKTDLTAHRTGGRLGDELDEVSEDTEDPTQMLVLVNNDSEETPDEIDYANQWADTSGNDDDLVKIELTPSTSGLVTGAYRLTTSASNVRLFNSDGTELLERSVNLAQPTVGDGLDPQDGDGNDLAALASGPIEIWLEGLSKNPDFSLALSYEDAPGHTISSDDVHMTIARWDFVGKDGAPLDEVPSYPKPALISKAMGETPFTALPDQSYFKVSIDGLPSSLLTSLRTTSDSEPSDYFEDEVAPNDHASVSADFGVFYATEESGDTLIATEREAIKSNLQLNAVHNESATTRATTGPAENPVDIQTRTLARMNLAPNWGRGIGAMQHNYHYIDLRFPAGTDQTRLADAIYTDLRAFSHFQPNIADVSFTNEQPFKRAHFELNSVGIPLLNLVDPNTWANVLGSIDVLIIPNNQARLVTAVTLGRHPLVGMRKWGVTTSIDSETQEVIARIKTEAWDRVSARNGAFPGMNAMGFMIGGNANQQNMWTNYLQQITTFWLVGDTPAGLPHATRRDGEGPMGSVMTNSEYYPDGLGSPDMADDTLNPFRGDLPTQLQANDPTLPKP